MLNVEDLTLEIQAPEDLGRAARVVVRILLNEKTDPSSLLSYVQSGQFKSDIDRTWLSKQGGGYGMSLVGGPVPVFARHLSDGNPDRTSEVTAYEQELSVMKWE